MQFCPVEAAACTPGTLQLPRARVAQVRVDREHGQIVVLWTDESDRLHRARCSLTGTNCQVFSSPVGPQVTSLDVRIDPVFGAGYVAASSAERTVVYRCDATLVTCKLIADVPGASVGRQSLGFDVVRRRLVLAMLQSANLRRPALGFLDLYP